MVASIIIVAILLVVFYGVVLYTSTHTPLTIAMLKLPHLRKDDFYYHGDDCPYMSNTIDDEELFLEWVWDNRDRIEPAFCPNYHYTNDYVFFITTPYILGGYMFLSYNENGIHINIANNENSLGYSVSKTSFGCNRNYVSTKSKRLWLKVYEYFDEQSKELNRLHGRNFVNPVFQK